MTSSVQDRVHKLQRELLQDLLFRENGCKIQILLSMPRQTTLLLTVVALVNREVAPLQKITFGNAIGSGSQGSIYECFIGEEKFAAKRVPKEKDGIREAEILESVGLHKNIVPLKKKI